MLGLLRVVVSAVVAVVRLLWKMVRIFFLLLAAPIRFLRKRYRAAQFSRERRQER